MAQEMQHNPDNMTPSLRAKLQAFAAELSIQEQEALRALQPWELTTILAPDLAEKARRAAYALSPEDYDQLERLLEPVLPDAVGYMKQADAVDPPGVSPEHLLIYGLTLAGLLDHASDDTSGTAPR
jgi:hypothetical protein